MFRLILAGLMLCLLNGATAAKDVKVGSATLNLVPPTGYCELEERQASDKRMLDAVRGMISGTNRLLAMSAACQQLTDWRSGKRPLLDDFAQYQTLEQMAETEVPAPYDRAIADLCSELRAQGDQLLSGMMPDIKSRAEKVMANVKVNEMRFMGVLAEDPNACYAGILQKFRTEAGTDKTQVGVFVTTIIRGKVVYYYLFSQYANSDTIVDLLAKHRANLFRLRSANP
jgi:hypothetical protein